MSLDEAWGAKYGAYLIRASEVGVGYLFTQNRFHQAMEVYSFGG
jgi:hypothetical protein